jgi:deoxyribodipyrimidine photo-lyase
MSAALPATLALGAVATRTPRFVVWFRNDLRVHDNPILSKIAALPGAKEIVPVVCLDPRQVCKGMAEPPHATFGSSKSSALRSRFLLETVSDLRAGLRTLGSDLLVGVGLPEELLPTLVQSPEIGPTTFVCQEQVTEEELAVDHALTRALKRACPQDAPQLRKIWSGTLYDDVQVKTLFGADYSSLPDVFTPFRNKVESKLDVAAPLPTPKPGSLPPPAADAKAALGAGAMSFDGLPSLLDLGFTAAEVAAATSCATDPRGVMAFPGGEAAALARVKHYLWDADCLGTYFETRNGMLGADYSSKFAPWLALGALSPRYVKAECERYEGERVKNKSTYWLVFELLWRDFFRFYAAKHGESLFHLQGPARVARPWKANEQLLQRWKEGKLGVPLVDANMRELLATGFMSNRGRQNVASYLALDLAIDWRAGAARTSHPLALWRPSHPSPCGALHTPRPVAPFTSLALWRPSHPSPCGALHAAHAPLPRLARERAAPSRVAQARRTSRSISSITTSRPTGAIGRRRRA